MIVKPWRYGLLAVLVIFNGALQSSAIPDPDHLPALWIGGSDALLKLDADTGNPLARTTDLNGASAIDIDDRGGVVWLYRSGKLVVLDMAGAKLREITVPGLDPSAGLPELKPTSANWEDYYCTHDTVQVPVATAPVLVQPIPKLAVDTVSGAAWLAVGRTLYRAKPDGTISLVATLPEAITGLSVETVRGKVWVGQCRSFRGYVRDGSSFQAWSFGTNASVVKDLEFDNADLSLWILQRVHLRRYKVAPSPQLVTSVPLNDTADQVYTFLAGNAHQAVWVTDDTGSVQLFRNNGSRAAPVKPFAGSAFAGITGVAANAKDGSAWVSNRSAVAHISATGAVLRTLTWEYLGGGPISAVMAVSHYVDAIPPDIDILEPAPGALIENSRPPIRVALTDIGTGYKDSTLRLSAANVPLSGTCTFANDIATCGITQDLPDGLVELSAEVDDHSGNRSSATTQFTVDTIPPLPPVSGLITNGPVVDGLTTVTGAPGSVEPNAQVVIRNKRTGQAVTVLSGSDGSFTAEVAAVFGDELEVFVRDAASHVGASSNIFVLPNAPSLTAPALSLTKVTPFHEATAFLYTGPNAIQTGVAPGTFIPSTVAVLRGRVLDRDQGPLPAVKVSVHGHPEFGSTVSRADGRFDLVVNGGDAVILAFQRDGFLPVQRQALVPWLEYLTVEDVVMTALSPIVTQIAPGAGIAQVAAAGVSTDADGARQAAIVFPSGTQASMVLPDGSTQPLSSLDVRLTEYTAGNAGRSAMPGSLPPTSGYTYAVELSVDQAIAAGAKSVQFNQPLPVYVDNFLNFPVGVHVPAAYYDLAAGKWMPSNNGRVLKVLSENPTTGAVIDTAGAGQPATNAQLAALGVTAEELHSIAARFDAGKTFWRIPVTHFSPWDFNFPWGPPPGAGPPPGSPPGPPPPPDSDDSSGCSGCIIEPQSQSLGEDIAVVGVPFGLHYRSERMPGAVGPTQTTVTLTEASVPASVAEIVLSVDIAGQHFSETFAPSPNLKYTFTWDGKDAYGRVLAGTYPAKITVGHKYGAVYYRSREDFAQSFGSVSGGASIGSGSSDGARTVTISREFVVPLRGLLASVAPIGGWTLTPHHFYDPSGRTLYSGDGTRTSAESMGLVVETLAGGGASNTWDIPAKNSAIKSFTHVAPVIAKTGEVYFAGPQGSQSGVFKIDLNGYLRKLINVPTSSIHDMDFGPDGALYLAAETRIYKLDTNNVLTVIAGNGVANHSGDGGPAVNAGLYTARSIDVTADGVIYFTDDANCNGGQRIRRIGPDGIVNNVWTGATGWCNYLSGIAVSDDGTIYMSRGGGALGVHVITAAGQVNIYLGGAFSSSGDGGPLALAKGRASSDIGLAPDGTVYINEYGVIRAVTMDGFINTIAGGGSLSAGSAEGGPATATSLGNGIAVDAAGTIYETGTGRIRRLRPLFDGYSASTISIPSKDGSQLFIFANSGRHLETKNAFTGTTLYTFGYNASGELTTITDMDGDITSIERNGTGFSAIVGPDGHRTTLNADPNGYLARVEDPAGNAHEMTYTPKGLLSTFETPKHHVSTYGYDPATGALVSDEDPAGGGWTLSTNASTSLVVTSMTSAEGRTSTFSVESLPNGDTKQIITGPDSTVTERITSPKASGKATAPDGTIVEVKEFADPRFGVQAPITTTTVTVPRATGNLVSTTTISRAATLSNSYDPMSLTAWSETTAINGKSQVRSYAPSTKTWTTTSPLNRQTVVTVDAKGRPATSKFANFETTTWTYTAQGRVDQATSGSGGLARTTDFNYYGSGPYAGFLQSVTDAENRTVSYEYDLAGRLKKQTLPDTRFIEYSYDANGNLESIIPPGRDPHVFHYTAVNLEDEYTPPIAANVGARRTQYSYNLDKDLDLITRPDGQTVDLVYAGPGKKLSSVEIPDGSYVYSYHPTKGYLTSLTAPGGQNLALAYDGTLPTSETASGVISGSVSWGYNNDFLVTSQGINGSALSFAYDNDGLLTTAGALTLTRNAITGLIENTTMASGTTTTTHTYNTFGESASDSAAYGGTVLYAATYPVRDKLGRIKEKSETIQGVATNYVYTYDAAGRLDTVTKNGVVTTYGHDSNGNRTAVNGATVATYDGQDRLLSYGAMAYGYTANGELLTKTESGATTTFAYDVLGNLRNVSLPAGVEVEYIIDGRNRLVGKKVNGVLVSGFLYGNQLEPVAELDGSGNVLSRFIYGSKNHIPDYMVKNAVTYRLVSDHLGSVRLVVRTTDGAVVQRMDYDEFGVVTNDTNPGFQPFGFAGGIYDQQTKLTRFGARDYDAQIGRWTGKDPIRFAGGDLNLYGYVLNDPINSIDPSGLLTGFLAANSRGVSLDQATQLATTSSGAFVVAGRASVVMGATLAGASAAPRTAEGAAVALDVLGAVMDVVGALNGDAPPRSDNSAYGPDPIPHTQPAPGSSSAPNGPAGSGSPSSPDRGGNSGPPRGPRGGGGKFCK